MNKIYTVLFCVTMLLIGNKAFSQETYNEEEGFEGKNLTSMHANTEWYKMMQTAEPNIFDIQKAYDKYFLVNTFVKSKETRAFEFWKKHIAEDNYDLNGFVGKQIRNDDDLALLQRQRSGMQKAPGQSNAANWTRIPIKPDMLPSWQSGSYTQGTCNMMAIHPTDTMQMIAAFVDGGTLWRTTDCGVTWTQCATNLLARHFGSVVYSKSNPLIVYAGCKQGVIKSTDGGVTWAYTAGFNQQSNYPTGSEIWAMEVKNDDPNTVLCAVGGTLYKTTNGGANWATSSLGNSIRDIRALPGNNNVAIATITTAAGPEVRRSTDFGSTWTAVAGFPYSLPNYDKCLAMAAVSDAEPNSVWIDYILKSLDANTKGESIIFKSTDGGVTFTKLCAADAMIGGRMQDMAGKFWQGTWNQAFCVSNTDTKIMAGGAYNTFVTSDNGATWYGNGDMGKTGPHSDVHGVILRGKTLWMVGDGGIARSWDFGRTYNHNVDDGIQSHCLWGFDQAWKSDVMAVGMYHGPTTIRDDNTYVGWYPGPGADAGKAYVNKGDDRYIYAHPWGNVRITRSSSRMVEPTKLDISYVSSSIGDMNDPDYYEKLYGNGGSNKGGDGSKIMISYNNATLFKDSIAFPGNVSDYIVAFTNNKIVYARAGNFIYRSEDGGATWKDASPKSVIGTQGLSNMAVDGVNPNILWATCGNKQTAIKVIKSTDGGATWSNYSAAGLPSYSVNCIVHQMGSNGGVYVGTDAGVYYRDNNLASWVPYSTNLPLATHVNWIKINYAKAKIRIAGQTGIWESDLFAASSPIAHPTTPYFETTVGKTVQYADMSVALADATYEWTFPDGTPSTSTLEKPSVVFNKGGDKNITLKVTDANGTDTRTYNGFTRIHGSTNVAKTSWTVIFSDSQMNTTTNADDNAIDNNTSTVWVSRGTGATKYPHDIQIDMGSPVSIESFKYMPRCDGFTTGQVRGYEWYVSNDGINWGTAVATGDFTSTVDEKTVTLALPVTARYFRFRPTSSIDGTGYASVAELGVIGTYGVISGFTASNTMVIPGTAVTFTDKSAGNPTSWLWSFPGGTPSTSTEQNPVVTYNSEGVYPVTLSVSNAEGGDVITKSSYITSTQFVPRTGWTVKYVDSQETIKEQTPATNMFDGNTSTFWGTDWSTNNTAYPHEVQIDMGANYYIAGFNYLPRQNSVNGRIASYEFYISTDGVNWTLTNSGTWPNSTTEQSQNFAVASARYIRLKALSEVNGNNWACVAELKVKVGMAPSTGLAPNTNNSNITIYSFANEIKVAKTDDVKSKVQVFDVMGKLMVEQIIGKGLNSIALQNSGVYIVKVSAGNNTVCRKVMIN